MPLFRCIFATILWMWLFFTCLMSRQKKREVRGTEGGTVCHFKGIETTTHILFTFLCLSCVTVYLLAKFVVWMCNMSIFMYVLYIIYPVVHRGLINIFLSLFTFSHMYFIRARDYKTTFSPTDLHWNTSISFQRSTVHVVHSYTDVREQKTLPSAAVLSLGPHLNSFLAWGSLFMRDLKSEYKKNYENKIL